MRDNLQKDFFSVSIQPGSQGRTEGGGRSGPDQWLEDRGDGARAGGGERFPGGRLPGHGGLDQGESGEGGGL